MLDFSFGETVKGYEVKVLNEREMRAGAGILFLGAVVAFMNAWLVGNFSLIKVFVVLFLIDFSIRLFINPKYAPSLIMGRFAVQNQTPEYVGAPQKKFAWFLGLGLATFMFFLVVIGGVMGPINLAICLICLTLLFFEAVFGICIGCKLYNVFNKEKAQLCPGNVCEVNIKQPIQKIDKIQKSILAIVLIALATFAIYITQNPLKQTQPKEKGCVVPEWAKKMGHEEKYKLHHGCS